MAPVEAETPPAPAAEADAPGVVLGPDGEPLAEWEIELAALGDAAETTAEVASASRDVATAPSEPCTLA